MSDAPDRIWADAHYGTLTSGYWHKEPLLPNMQGYIGTEYTRADLVAFSNYAEAEARGYRAGLEHAAEAVEEYCANEAFGKLLASVILDMAATKEDTP